jgi:hypothetical protein
VPTRLLDWTEGALLALFFAVRTAKVNSGCDGAVWALDPYKLNQRVLAICKDRDWVPGPCAPGTSPEEFDEMEPWLPRRFRGKRLMSSSRPPESAFAVIPPHTALRISTQRSCFTVHGADRAYLDDLAGGEEGAEYLDKITIPRDRAAWIRRELDSCGIDEATVFPDLDHLGKVLCLKFSISGGGHRPPDSGTDDP